MDLFESVKDLDQQEHKRNLQRKGLIAALIVGVLGVIFLAAIRSRSPIAFILLMIAVFGVYMAIARPDVK